MSERGWVDFAREMQDAGAKGIELNVFYIPTEMYRSGQQIEQLAGHAFVKGKDKPVIEKSVKSRFALPASLLQRRNRPNA